MGLRQWIFVFIWIGLVGMIAPNLASATTLNGQMLTAIKKTWPQSTVRLDGAIQTSASELFLPLIPQGGEKKHSNIQVLSSFPNSEKPDLILFSNGWCFLRVIKRGKALSVVLPRQLPEKSRRQVMACRFPSDLIVPEQFYLPQSFKVLVGDTAVVTVADSQIARPDFGCPLSSSPSGPGSICLTSVNSGMITIVDDGKFAKQADFPTEGTPYSMAWAKGHLYITDQAKNRVLILDPIGKQFLGQIDLVARSAPKGIACLPNGRLLYVSESGSNDVAVVETETGKVLLRTKVASGPGTMDITPDGENVIVLNVPSGLVTFISTFNQKVLGTVPSGQVPTAIAITKDSKVAYISNRLSNTISVIDITERRLVRTIATGAGPTGVSLSADESTIYVAQAKENTIGVYKTATGSKVADVRLPLDVDFPFGIELMPDGRRLLVSSESTDTIAYLDVSTLQFAGQSTIGHSSHDLLWVPVR